MTEDLLNLYLTKFSRTSDETMRNERTGLVKRRNLQNLFQTPFVIFMQQKNEFYI